MLFSHALQFLNEYTKTENKKLAHLIHFLISILHKAHKKYAIIGGIKHPPRYVILLANIASDSVLLIPNAKYPKLATHCIISNNLI